MTKEEFYKNRIWYHATTKTSVKAILSKGVLAKININVPLDFGNGFYLCPNFSWCQKYIKSLLDITDDDIEIHSDDGYILEFEFCPKEYEKTHRNIFWEDLDKKFAKFVFKNRMYYKYHFIRHCVHNYDFVGGPMSDGKQIDDFNEYILHRITKGELYERLLIPKEDWQLLLHSQKMCDKVKLKKIYNLKGDEVDVENF